MRSLTSLIEIAEGNNGFHLVLSHPRHAHAHTQTYMNRHTIHTHKEGGLACKSAEEVVERKKIFTGRLKIMVNV